MTDNRLKLRIRAKLNKPGLLCAHDFVIEDIDTGRVLPCIELGLFTSVNQNAKGGGVLTATVTFFPEELDIQNGTTDIPLDTIATDDVISPV